MNKIATFAPVLAPVLALGLTVGLWAGCGSSAPKGANPAPPVEVVDAAPAQIPGIAFDINPGDAEVIVDGESLGSAANGDIGEVLELVPGLHQIMIRHADYETYRVEVTIGEKTELLQINLQAKAR